MKYELLWECEGCGARFAEYVNGCPKCYEGRKARGLFPLHASVRQVSGAQEEGEE